MQEMPFQRPKFQKIFGGACPRTPLQLCRYYGLPLTKILATPLIAAYHMFFARCMQTMKDEFLEQLKIKYGAAQVDQVLSVD